MKSYIIKKSDIDKKGRGLYATKDIKEGTKIIDCHFCFRQMKEGALCVQMDFTWTFEANVKCNNMNHV